MKENRSNIPESSCPPNPQHLIMNQPSHLQWIMRNSSPIRFHLHHHKQRKMFKNTEWIIKKYPQILSLNSRCCLKSEISIKRKKRSVRPLYNLKNWLRGLHKATRKLPQTHKTFRWRSSSKLDFLAFRTESFRGCPSGHPRSLESRWNPTKPNRYGVWNRKCVRNAQRSTMEREPTHRCSSYNYWKQIKLKIFTPVHRCQNLDHNHDRRHQKVRRRTP